MLGGGAHCNKDVRLLRDFVHGFIAGRGFLLNRGGMPGFPCAERKCRAADASINQKCTRHRTGFSLFAPTFAVAPTS